MVQPIVPPLDFKGRHSGLCIVVRHVWIFISNHVRNDPSKTLPFPRCFLEIWNEKGKVLIAACKVSQVPFPFKLENRQKAPDGPCELLLNQACYPHVITWVPLEKRKKSEKPPTVTFVYWQGLCYLCSKLRPPASSKSQLPSRWNGLGFYFSFPPKLQFNFRVGNFAVFPRMKRFIKKECSRKESNIF